MGDMHNVDRAQRAIAALKGELEDQAEYILELEKQVGDLQKMNMGLRADIKQYAEVLVNCKTKEEK